MTFPFLILNLMLGSYGWAIGEQGRDEGERVGLRRGICRFARQQTDLVADWQGLEDVPDADGCPC